MVTSLFAVCNKFKPWGSGVFDWQAFYIKIGFLDLYSPLVVPEFLDLCRFVNQKCELAISLTEVAALCNCKLV
jgi:hypothetical protein